MDQPLTEWAGDVSSLLREMKRRANVRTDTDLAAALGLNQSTVSTWRRRGSIPEPVLLAFEDKIRSHSVRLEVWRFIAARAIAMRVAAFMADIDEPLGGGGAWTAYQTVSMGFNSLVDAINADLETVPGLGELGTFEVAQRFLQDQAYLARFAQWIKTLPIKEALDRDVRAGLRVEKPSRPVGPQ